VLHLRDTRSHHTLVGGQAERKPEERPRRHGRNVVDPVKGRHVAGNVIEVIQHP
jgi:hypothetical protein